MECRLDRLTVHYETFGEGRPILMLHGMPLDHHEMVYEMERHFAKRVGWRRIYLDMPGHGETPGADWITSTNEVLDAVEDFVDHTIPNGRFVVAGTSYGAYIARGLVYRRGAEMDGLLLNVPLMRYTKPTLPNRNVLLRDAGMMDTAKREGMGWIEEVTVSQTQDVLDYARALKASAADQRFLRKLRVGFSFEVDKPPEPFPAPSLFIMGRQDHWCGYRDAWDIIENYPRATFAVLDHAGHLVAGEQQQLCSALIQEWLDRVEEWTHQTHPNAN